MKGTKTECQPCRGNFAIDSCGLAIIRCGSGYGIVVKESIDSKLHFKSPFVQRPDSTRRNS